MTAHLRFLTLEAGPFRLALPLEDIKQILDAGGDQASAPVDRSGRGLAATSLARVLGAMPREVRPAYLLFDHAARQLMLSTCVLGTVIDVADAPRPLPSTVACRRPGLIEGTLRDPLDGGLRLVLDVGVLTSLAEAP